MHALQIIRFFSLAFLMLITGVFWGTWFSLSRSIEKFAPASFLAIGKVIIGNLARPMRVLMPLTILLMLAGLLLIPSKAGLDFYASLLSFVLIVAALLITLLVEVPIDNRIREWTPATLPGNWEALRDRWERYHALRTFCSLAAFILLLLAALVL